VFWKLRCGDQIQLDAVLHAWRPDAPYWALVRVKLVLKMPCPSLEDPTSTASYCEIDAQCCCAPFSKRPLASLASVGTQSRWSRCGIQARACFQVRTSDQRGWMYVDAPCETRDVQVNATSRANWRCRRRRQYTLCSVEWGMFGPGGKSEYLRATVQGVSD
jgi:hypothetical protein